MGSTSLVWKRLCLRLFNRKSIINYIIISLSSVAILFGLINYTPSVDKMRAKALDTISKMSTSEYFKEDISTVNDIKAEYKDKLKQQILKQDLSKTVSKFNKAVSKVKTKPEMIKSLIKKLEKYRKDIYSDEDKESAKELIHKFKIGAKEDSSKEALKDRYLDIEEQILRFKTVKQHEEEEARKVKIAARWTVAGSNEYPFKLSSDGNFIMPIDMNGSHGYLTGKWELDNTTVTIHILKNTVDENYKPYDWIFNYDEDSDTLVGTGQFAGWEYTKY
ncbi:hypothetical protein [Mogibacterium diversum]|uniref:hypothetical protein n=1 Tax=Mogibacterium diversum TaxID=114527 RepID=UPI001CAB3A95|nr:hypothetical protein [Mogibacterium diversum]MBF1320005.1 hypothetical protein [Mogibacterium diversum]